MKYDFLIVGSGLFGAVFAHQAKQAGKKCLVIDRRPQLGGNVFCEEKEGIHVHTFGAHIFHTADKQVWDFVNELVSFNRYTNCPVANYKGELYNLPFNMNTFYQMWGVHTPEEAQAKIKNQQSEIKNLLNGREPANLEEQALMLVGRDIYELLIKGYTEKQWGRPCSELPAFIIRRLPVRFSYDNNYFDAMYQGIPVDGYTVMIAKMLEGVDVRLNCDYFADRNGLESLAGKIIFTGQIDAYFDHSLGVLEYRTLRFETEILNDTDNFQGNAIVNYTERDIPFTRCMEHKHFYPGLSMKGTVLTREYSSEWTQGSEPYYPVNNERNNSLCEQYKALAREKCPDVIFAGRLGEYKYYDMDAAVSRAIEIASQIS